MANALTREPALKHLSLPEWHRLLRIERSAQGGGSERTASEGDAEAAVCPGHRSAIRRPRQTAGENRSRVAIGIPFLMACFFQHLIADWEAVTCAWDGAWTEKRRE